MEQPLLHCSFCGRSQREVTHLVAAPGRVQICETCIADAAASIGNVVIPSGDRRLERVALHVGAALQLLDDAIAAAVAARKPLANWQAARAAAEVSEVATV